jgi:hypothetical protein
LQSARGSCYKFCLVVGVAQLAEHWVVAPEVVGSSPITHPNFFNKIIML